jgi:GT2 family glycosyltransferase
VPGLPGGVTAVPGTREGLDDVDVVFLVWREPAGLLDRHHAAVSAATGAGWRGRALLVENDAAPATSSAAREAVRRCYPRADRRVLRSPRNLGFAAAMDLAVDACAGRYVALLNSDGRPAPDMLRVLAAVLDEHPDAVWAAPAVHGPGEDRHPPGEPYDDEELGGTALLLRREAFLAAGGFDPAYWFYNEDREASRRFRRLGWRLLRVPATRFDHGKEGRTAAGMLRREHLYARTVQVLVLQHADRALRRVHQLLARRVRAVGAHLRAGDGWGAAGLVLATAELPRGLAVALARRRRPWDGARLAGWLDRARRDVECVPLP